MIAPSKTDQICKWRAHWTRNQICGRTQKADLWTDQCNFIAGTPGSDFIFCGVTLNADSNYLQVPKKLTFALKSLQSENCWCCCEKRNQFLYWPYFDFNIVMSKMFINSVWIILSDCYKEYYPLWFNFVMNIDLSCMIPTSLCRHSAWQYSVYKQVYFTPSKWCLEKELHAIQLFFSTLR